MVHVLLLLGGEALKYKFFDDDEMYEERLFNLFLNEKKQEDNHDSIFIDKNSEELEAEIWGRIFYESVMNDLENYYKHCKNPQDESFHVSSEEKFFFTLNRLQCKYEPMCVGFVGDYSEEEVYNLTKEAESQIEKAILQSIRQGYNIFVFGLFTEMELFAAEIVLKYKEAHPDIKVICATLYNKYEFSCGFAEAEIMRSHAIMQQADYCKFFFDEPVFASVCNTLWEDNMLAYTWIVNISKKLIGATRNPRTFTKCVFNYAVQKNVKVEKLDLF